MKLPSLTHSMSKPFPRYEYQVQHEPEVHLHSLSATTLSKTPPFPIWTTEIASELILHFHSGLLLVYSP